MALAEPLAGKLAEVLSRSWWALLLRGLAAVLFGLLTFAQPGITLVSLAFLFGTYALVDGLLTTLTAISRRQEQAHWWMLLLEGLFGVAVGGLTLLNPALPAFTLVFYIAIRAIATGALEVVMAIRLRKEIDNEWRLVLAGLASIAFGLFLAARPGAGALAALWIIAAFSLVFGLLFIVLAFRVKSLAHTVEAHRA